MKSLQLHILCKKASALNFYSQFHTNAYLLARFRGRKAPRALSYDPGIRHRENLMKSFGNTEDLLDAQDFNEEIDVMNLERASEEEIRRTKQQKKFAEFKYISKKFFDSGPQPLMLTWNERECIKYLHKSDPIQWDLKTLSESFPATPQIIKKVLKSRRKNITPEIKKLQDEKVQSNWDLLAKDELKADPKLISHLKKFINRREVLLEQIKNENFYLPEIEHKRVWNQGEMSGILTKYEKAVEKLLGETEHGQQKQLLGESTEKVSENEKSLETLHESIIEKARRLPENKDNFTLGVTNKYGPETTLKKLEDFILKKANSEKKLSIFERAILTSSESNNNYNSSQNKDIKNSAVEKMEVKAKKEVMGEDDPSSGEIINSYNDQEIRSLGKYVLEKANSNLILNLNKKSVLNTNLDESQSKNSLKDNRNYSNFENHLKSKGNKKESQKIRPFPFEETSIKIDPRTEMLNEITIGQFIHKESNNSKSNDDDLEQMIAEDKHEKSIKEEVDEVSAEERLRRENLYYDKEVEHIKNTAFWNDKRSNVQKAEAELQKRPHGGPSIPANFQGAKNEYQTDSYPERIKIPKSKQGSGLIFKVKDCYYDDDGEFLYRVPGMTK